MAAQHDFNDTDPLMEHTDDHNDDDDGYRTGPFQIGEKATPGYAEQIPIRTTTMNRPERPSLFHQTSDESASTAFTAESCLHKEFPYADKMKLEYKMDKNGRQEVSLSKSSKPYHTHF